MTLPPKESCSAISLLPPTRRRAAWPHFTMGFRGSGLSRPQEPSAGKSFRCPDVDDSPLECGDLSPLLRRRLVAVGPARRIPSLKKPRGAERARLQRDKSLCPKAPTSRRTPKGALQKAHSKRRVPMECGDRSPLSAGDLSPSTRPPTVPS